MSGNGAAPEALETFLIHKLSSMSEADPTLLSNYVLALLGKPLSREEKRELLQDQLQDFLKEGTDEFVAELFNELESGGPSKLPSPAQARVQSGATFAEEGNDEVAANTARYPEDMSPRAGRGVRRVREDVYENEKRAVGGGSADARWQSERLSTGRGHKRQKPSDGEDRFGEGSWEDSREEEIGEDVENGGNPKPVVVRMPSSLARRHADAEEESSDEDDARGLRHRRRLGRSLDEEEEPADTRARPPVDRADHSRHADRGFEGRRNGAWEERNGARGGGNRGGGFGNRERIGGRSGPGPRWEGPRPGPPFRGGNRGGWPRADRGFSGPPFGEAMEYGRGMLPGHMGPPFFPGPGMMGQAGPFGGPAWSSPPFGAGLRGPVDAGGAHGGAHGLRRNPCPDFEEAGVCLRGPHCPFDHGRDRILVDDVQSLERLNLPLRGPLGSNQGGLARSPPARLQGRLAGRLDPSTAPDGAAVERYDPDDFVPDQYDPEMPLWLQQKNEASPSVEAEAGVVNGNSDAITLVAPDQDRGRGAPAGPRHPADVDEELVAGGGRQGRRNFGAAEGQEQRQGSHMGAGRGRGWAGRDGDGGQGVGRGPGAKGQAECTLFVSSIPEEVNHIRPLLTHFRKFSQQVEIKVMPNSNRAFVQLGARAEAEAALTSPEAVCGNRFIRLGWAHHDIRPPHQRPAPLATAAAAQQTPPAPAAVAPSGEKKKAELLLMMQKKQEELLRLRIAQQKALLAAKLQKASAKTGEEESKKRSTEVAAEGGSSKQVQAVEPSTPSATGSAPASEGTPSKTPPQSAEGAQEADKQDAVRPAGPLQGSSKKRQLAPGLQSPAGVLAGQQVWASGVGRRQRFKLDNRTTVLHLQPPLPPNTPHEVLQLHFIQFGEISELEMAAAEAEAEGAQAAWAARIVYARRADAEAAMLHGRQLQGHPLTLSWGPPAPSGAPPGAAVSTPLKAAQPAEGVDKAGTAEPVAAAAPQAPV